MTQATPKQTAIKRDHAIVIGGGIGGLLTAQALVGQFAQVTVLERAAYGARIAGQPPPSRRGVPQSNCLHLLMGAGVEAFDALVPGWRQKALAQGALAFDACADTVMRFPAGWVCRAPSSIETYACSRALLEDVLREMAGVLDPIRILPGTAVTGLLATLDHGRVVGVKTDRGDMPADLVVDVSGAASRMRRWLGDMLGADQVQIPETIVQSGRKYISRWVHLDPARAPDWQCLAISPSAGGTTRSAMMLRAENNFWGVVLLAPSEGALPETDADFQAFAESLDDPELSRILSRATAASSIQNYGHNASRMRHFDQFEPWPDGLVALGDAVCALDPYYGLGMTSAARGALCLREFLAQGAGPARAFQQRLAEVNRAPWELVTGHDRNGQAIARDNARLAQIYAQATQDPDIAKDILAVHHLLKPMAQLTEGEMA